LFAPTKVQEEILVHDGISSDRIFVVGNTIVDAVLHHKDMANETSQILNTLDLSSGQYVLVTAHRALNVDTRKALSKLVAVIESIPKITGHPVVYPIHPRTKAKLDQYKLSISGVKLIEPLGYLDFLQLEQHAAMIVTDSGGIQEEACILQIPCITIRENTERPETVSVGANRLVDLDMGKFKEAVSFHQNNNCDWPNPFGDGHTAEHILEVLQSRI
jgi:UDP-N-acetylglucosamine 2-epimerase (non-hydrolysing)